MILLSNKQCSELLGINSRLVKHWTSRSLVYPEKMGLQQGSKHGYSYRNLFEMKLISEFFGMGLTIARVRWIMEELNEKKLIQRWLNNQNEFFEEEVSRGAYFNDFRDDQNQFEKKLDQAILEFCEYCYLRKKEYQSTLFYIDFREAKDVALILPSPYFPFSEDKSSKMGYALHYIFNEIIKGRGILIDLTEIKKSLDEVMVL